MGFVALVGAQIRAPVNGACEREAPVPLWMGIKAVARRMVEGRGHYCNPR